MTDKQLRKLKRADLIEILYYLKRENEELHAENDKLRSKLDAVVDEAKKKKNDAFLAAAGADDEKTED